jgi:hypothetical protein
MACEGWQHGGATLVACTLPPRSAAGSPVTLSAHVLRPQQPSPRPYPSCYARFPLCSLIGSCTHRLRYAGGEFVVYSQGTGIYGYCLFQIGAPGYGSWPTFVYVVRFVCARACVV